KVYFSFENTAIFVFNMIMVDEELMLILNTGDKIKLDPEKLFTYDDSLFTRTREHTIKFTEHVLIKLSKYLEEEAGEFSIKIKDRIYAIPEQNLDEC
ncbi:MAG: MFS transporter permease, partial [Desulfobacteraceae bacterium]|nr:MFS transporter permease [Desulfobacteraceae bacterium]